MQWMNNPKNTCVFVASSLYETRLHRIMVVVFIKANIQSKMMNEYNYQDSLRAHLRGVEGTGH